MSLDITSINDGKTFKIGVTSQNMKSFLRNDEIVVNGAIDFDYNPISQGVFKC